MDEERRILPADQSETVSASGTVGEGVPASVGRYKLLEKVGEGGFGTVYVAEQREPVKRRVALKIIKLGMDTRQVVARFEAERQALAMMDHPNIAKVLDAGATETGRPYFVMELVRGIPITQYCDENHLPTTQRLLLFIQVCHAIQHAHQKGIIHRDIKPTNILVTLHDGVPVPKVIDFGIAKATQGELTDKTIYTQFQQFVGTPAYMSPEQAEMSGLDIDTRSDIYSLGVLLYELLVGQTPFDARELLQSGVDAMRRTLREKEPIRPSTRLGGMTGEQRTSTARRRGSDAAKLIGLLKGDLDWIVLRCLEKDRTRRYETANGLAMDVRRFLDLEPISARAPGRFYRLQKMARRNKLAFVAVGAVFASLVIGMGVSTWLFVGERRARQIAVAAEREQNRLRQVAETAQANESKQRQAAQAMELVARRQAYAADLNLVQQAVAENQIGRAQELLQRTRPLPGQSDLRGWEWRYLWQLCCSDALFSLCRRPNAIWALAASPDGRFLAIGEYEKGGLTLWDLRSRTQVAILPAGDSKVHAAFSPTQNVLAFTSESGAASARKTTVSFYDVVTKQARAPIILDGDCVGIAFSGDGRVLATSTKGKNGRITLWQVNDGKQLASYPAPYWCVDEAIAFAIAPDLSVAAYGSGEVHVIDLGTGRERWKAQVTSQQTMAMTFSPDGKTLATAGGYHESSIRLWDVSRGNEIGRLEGHRFWVGAMVFWPDGKTLASASADTTIRVWDLHDLAKVPPPRVLAGHQSEAWRVTLLPSNTTLVSGSDDGEVDLWDAANTKPKPTSRDLPGSTVACRFAIDGKSMLALDRQGQVRRWHAPDFTQSDDILQTQGELSSSFKSAVISADGGMLVRMNSVGDIAKVWDLRERVLVRQIKCPSGSVPIQFVDQNRKLLLADVRGALIDEWDLFSGLKTRSWRSAAIVADQEHVQALSPDQRWCLTLGFGGTSVMCDLLSGSAADANLDIRHASDVAFSPDGKFFGAATDDHIVKVWETASLRPVTVLKGSAGPGFTICFSPDSRRVATRNSETTSHQGAGSAMAIWDLEGSHVLLRLPLKESIGSAEFSPDGNQFAVICWDGTVRIWQAPSWAEIESAERAR